MIQAQNDQIDLYLFFQNLWKFKKKLVLSSILSALICGIISLIPTPKYSISTVLTPSDYSKMISQSGSSFGGMSGIGNLVGLNIGDESNVAETIETIQSFYFLSKFIIDNELMHILYPNSDGVIDKIKGYLKGDEDVTLWEAHKFFNKEVMSINYDRTTNIVTISILWEDPNVATEWANQLVNSLNLFLKTKELDRLERNNNYLSEKLIVVNSQDIRSALIEILKIQTRQSMLAVGYDNFALKVIDPAHPSPIDQYTSPNHILFIIFGFIIGLAGSSLWVIRIILDEENDTYGK